jgi:FkbM family methyltransferase
VPFYGTRFTSFPSSLKIGAQRVEVSTPGERGIVSDLVNVLLDDEYGLANLEPPRTILDVGANIGLFSLAARSYFPEAKIVACEPNPRLVPFLEGNTRAAGIDVRPVAVGPRHGRASMCDESESRLATTKSSESGTIPMIALSQLVEELGGVDLLKLDCEGCEWELFAKREQLEGVRRVRMEYHHRGSMGAPEFMTVAGDAGFHAVRHAANASWGILWLERKSAG